MKKTILYTIIVLVILVIIVVGLYSFSPVGQYTGYRWKCTDTEIYTCPPDAYWGWCTDNGLECFGPVNASYSCPNDYASECVDKTLTCTYTRYTCSWSNPGDCTKVGTCSGSGGGGGGCGGRGCFVMAW